LFRPERAGPTANTVPSAILGRGHPASLEGVDIVRSVTTTVKQWIKLQIRRACAGPSFRKTICWSVSRPEPLVAITFDDGPNTKETALVLDILEEWHAPATFFLQGDHVEQHPDMVRRIALAGHQIGNHGYDHSKRDLPRQVQRCDQALQR
jgi:peptidoglycan/xylan/chitin deacetylase (PgdA/CDA1 family)